MNFILQERLPTVEEYNHLRNVAGWPVYNEDTVKKGLSNSLYAACVMQDATIIGMARVIGDGAIYLHVQDVIVHPDHQRNGIGKILMQAVMRFVEETGVKNTNVGVMCSKGRERFYEKYGFVQRPGEKFGAGMIKILS